MKICYLVDGLRCGGRERQLLELVSGLLQPACGLTGRDLVIISLSPETDFFEDRFKDLGIIIYHITRRFRYDLLIISKMIRILRKHNIRIIHTFDTISSFFAGLLKMISNLKFIDGSIRIAPLRVKRRSWQWLLSRFTFRIADVIVSNSRAGLRSFEVKIEKGLCIHNGLGEKRLEEGNKERIVSEFDLKGKKVIGMVANFTDKKDHRTFIQAALKVRSSCSDCAFLLIGSGPGLDMLRKKWKNESALIFTGNRDDIDDLVAAFDIGVLTTFSEGISNSIMEYMAQGKPVIAARGGGTDELVVEGETGYLIEQGQTEQLARYLTDLLEDPERCLKMGEAGKKLIERNFNSVKMVKSYYDIYRKLEQGMK